MSEENKHKHLHDYLKGLPKVKSRNDFEQRLSSRLRNVESEKFSSPSVKKLTGKKFSILDLLKPSLVPAIGLTIILLVFIAYYINISKKEGQVNQISQNEKPSSSQTGKDQNQNKSSDSFIVKNETISPTGDNLKSKENQTKSPGSTISKDYDVAPTLVPEHERNFEDEQFSSPKSEEKKADELKESKDLPKIEDKKEAPVMKKSVEMKLNENELKGNDRDKIQIEGKEDINESNRSVEQSITNDTTNAADSTKSIKLKKNYKKNSILNDTIKIPAQKPIQKENYPKK